MIYSTYLHVNLLVFHIHHKISLNCFENFHYSFGGEGIQLGVWKKKHAYSAQQVEPFSDELIKLFNFSIENSISISFDVSKKLF